ncbi:MFS transporter [Streptomyces sp. A7024]|uniref:MFS transporter n=2 Tax=Streptomyces coryli TaxID=1128680 RepID=A0A6G4U5C2_9ACTN|nr:MFS transporter [Streptomyces coryli]NGN66940.1 MFS transporter [Streptomyces coryli]
MPMAKPAYRDANVLRWLVAYTLSLIGDGVYFVALAWTAEKVAGPAEVGLVMAAGSVPRAVLMLFGGVLADRIGPRRLVIGSDAARCLIMFGLAAAIAMLAPGLWLLVVVALVFGAVDALFVPAVGALPPRVAPASELARVVGMRGLALRLGNNMAGPGLGGVVMATTGSAGTFAVAGVLFALSLPLLVAVRLAPLSPKGEEETAEASGTAWRDLVEGLRYARRHPVVGPLLLSGALSEFGLNGLFNIGMVLLTSDRGWGAGGQGALIASLGVGSAASAALLAVKGRLPRAGAVQNGTLLVASVTLGAVVFAPSLAWAAAFMALGGAVAGICGGLAQALIQTAADPHYIGRVTSLMGLTSLGIGPMCYPLIGAAVSQWGLTPVFLTGAGISCLGAVVGLSAAAVRKAELPRNGADLAA